MADKLKLQGPMIADVALLRELLKKILSKEQ